MSVKSEADNDFIPKPVRRIAPYWILSLIVFAAYGNIFNNVFLFDDDLLIQLNSYIGDWHHIKDLLLGSTTGGAHIEGGFYRPIQMLLYLFAFHLGNGSTFWFHILNLTLHIANTCFVYRIGTKLKFNPWAVFWGALIWGLHPLHTEAVTYMSATADPLFAFFCLWGIVSLLPDCSQQKIYKVIPLFLLGLLSKETAVMFPLLVMSCIFLTNPNRLQARSYIPTWPLWIISLIFIYWRLHAEGLSGPQTYGFFYKMQSFSHLKAYADNPSFRIYTFLATLPCYLKLLIVPTGLHMERAFSIYTDPMHPPVIVGLVMLLFSAGAIFYYSRLNKGIEMCWGLLWFAVAHAPDTGLLVPMNALFLEHWMYLPSIGLFLGSAQTVAKMSSHSAVSKKSFAAAAIAFASLMLVLTYNQNKIWRGPLSFYTNIFDHGEPSARSHNNLALYYSDSGQYDAALDQFDQAIKISDGYAETRYNMAITYLRISTKPPYVDMAIDSLKRSLEISPNFFRSYITLAEIYSKVLHDPKTAAIYYKRAAEIFTPE